MTLFKKNKKNQGQALLVVVIFMIVSLTVILSLTLRSVNNIRMSTEEDNSKRAFSAAEAGIEIMLNTKSNITESINLLNNSSISKGTRTIIEGSTFLINGENLLKKDDGGDIWLVSSDSNGSPDYSNPWSGDIEIYWGTNPPISGSCSNAAVEIVVISGRVTSPSVANSKFSRYTYDSCIRSPSNNFTMSTNVSYPILGKMFYNKTALSIINGYIIRVVPIYEDTFVAVKSDIKPLPVQGFKIESTGSSMNTERKITFVQGNPRISSELFLYTILSPSTIYSAISL